MRANPTLPIWPCEPLKTQTQTLTQPFHSCLQAPFPWKQARHAPDMPWPPLGLRLSVNFTAPTTSLPAHRNVVVTAHYEMYSGAPVVSKWLEVVLTTSSSGDDVHKRHNPDAISPSHNRVVGSTDDHDHHHGDEAAHAKRAYRKRAQVPGSGNNLRATVPPDQQGPFVLFVYERPFLVRHQCTDAAAHRCILLPHS
jgi:hypothetical protein